MVGFRYFTSRLAEETGVGGYVKNLATGDVEIVACGDKGKLDSFIDRVSRGPTSADVKSVKVDRTFESEEEFKDFRVRY